jgi:hypothetical protein
MRTSIGALQTDSKFFNKNSRADRVMSARSPTAKVTVARDKPMTVRYWKCHPYASLLTESQLLKNLGSNLDSMELTHD